MSRHLEAMVKAIEKERHAELEALRERLQLCVINLPCDVSAIDPDKHSAAREVHKQARHTIAEFIAEIWPT